ncbi:MAG TPA: hypothetical protein PKE64_16035 [Anaerolineae bacterium]|nr:hypothetical protein [Anaerolineae bacterium]HMR65517.1 hypothetical protein [Anaerolineae bacterium]
MLPFSLNKSVVLITVLFLVGVMVGACGDAMTAKDIVEVQAKHEAQLMSLPGVVGVGIGECEGKPCLKVLVERKTPELERQIPSELEGFKVELEESGPLQTQPR